MTQNTYCWAGGVDLGRAGSVETNTILSIFSSHSLGKLISTAIAMREMWLKKRKYIDLKNMVLKCLDVTE